MSSRFIARASVLVNNLARTCARQSLASRTAPRVASASLRPSREGEKSHVTMAAAAPSIEDAAPGAYDRYGGYIVDDAHEAFAQSAVSPEAFADALGRWMRRWREEGTRGVWLKIALERAALVPVARDHGFEFHHAEKEYVMMTCWLPEDEPSTIPANASHQVGVGAFVFDEENKKVLLVQERRGPASGRDLWKMPTGLLEAGEDIPIAAMREVMEETGIDTEFDAVIGCRHGHFGLFGKSDLFFCVGLRVKDGASREIKIQETEIERAKWASVDEFLDNPNIEAGSHAHELHKLCAKWSAREYAGISAKHLPLGFGRPGKVYTYVNE